MEEKDYLKMLQLYKAKLADAEERGIMYQAVISKQVTEMDMLKQVVQNLELQIQELTQPEPVAE